MIDLSNIRNFLVNKGRTLNTHNNTFIPPVELQFSQGFNLFIPTTISNQNSEFLNDTAELISSVYSNINKNDLLASVMHKKDVFSIRINDTDNHDGSIGLDSFEYFIDKAKSILLKTAQFVVEKKPKLEGTGIEARKYLAGCRFLQTEKGSFIANISLSTEDIIKERTLFDEELKAEEINKKIFEMLDFIHGNFFDLPEGEEESILSNIPSLIETHKDKINIDVFKEIKYLYDKSGINNICYNYFNYHNIEPKKTQPSEISPKYIQVFDSFITTIDHDLRKESIDSYGKITDLHGKDRNQEETTKKIVLEVVQYGLTSIVVYINKDQFANAIKTYERCGIVKIKGKGEKTKDHINVTDIEELEFVGVN